MVCWLKYTSAEFNSYNTMEGIETGMSWSEMPSQKLFILQTKLWKASGCVIQIFTYIFTARTNKRPLNTMKISLLRRIAGHSNTLFLMLFDVPQQWCDNVEALPATHPFFISMNKNLFKSEAALVWLPASPLRQTPCTPALISFSTCKREAFSQESSLVQASEIAFFIKSRLIKLQHMELGHRQEIQMFPIMGFGGGGQLLINAALWLMPEHQACSCSVSYWF